MKRKREDKTEDKLPSNSQNNSLNNLNNTQNNLNSSNKKSKLEEKKDELKIIEDIIKNIEKSENFKNYIKNIVTNEDKSAIDLILKRHKYFAEYIEHKEELLDLIMENVCTHGKVDILKNLADAQKINFKKYSNIFYTNNGQDLLTIAATHNQQAMIKYLLEQDSLFILSYFKDAETNGAKSLATKDELYDYEECLVVFEILFMQSIFKSNYDQNVKSEITNILLEFMNNAQYSNQAKENIVNNIIHDAHISGAYKALNRLIDYTDNNKLKLHVTSQGLFSEVYDQFHNKWQYDQIIKHIYVIKTIERITKVDTYNILREEPDLREALEKASIIIEAKNNQINWLVNLCKELLSKTNNSNNGQSDYYNSTNNSNYVKQDAAELGGDGGAINDDNIG